MKFPNILPITVAICAICLSLSSPVLAQAPPPVTKFSGVGTGTTTLSYYVVTANAAGSGLLKFLDATSDAAAICQFYSAGAPVSVTAADIITNIITAPGTGFASPNVIVLRHVATDTYQRLVVSSATATNITTTANIGAVTAVGDQVYKMTANGSVTVGVANKQINAGGGFIYAGQPGRPILLETTGGTNCAINLVAGSFEK
jgi:hypothetical protein